MKLIIILAAIVLFILMVIFCGCRVSGNISRQEEKKEMEKRREE